MKTFWLRYLPRSATSWEESGKSRAEQRGPPSAQLSKQLRPPDLPPVLGIGYTTPLPLRCSD